MNERENGKRAGFYGWNIEIPEEKGKERIILDDYRISWGVYTFIWYVISS